MLKDEERAYLNWVTAKTKATTKVYLPTQTPTTTTNLQRPTCHLREMRYILRVVTPEDSDGIHSTDEAQQDPSD